MYRPVREITLPGISWNNARKLYDYNNRVGQDSGVGGYSILEHKKRRGSAAVMSLRKRQASLPDLSISKIASAIQSIQYKLLEHNYLLIVISELEIKKTISEVNLGLFFG